jgi:hypothetical protein
MRIPERRVEFQSARGRGTDFRNSLERRYEAELVESHDGIRICQPSVGYGVIGIRG